MFDRLKQHRIKKEELVFKAARHIIGCVVCDRATYCRPEQADEQWRCPLDSYTVTRKEARKCVKRMGQRLVELVEPTYRQPRTVLYIAPSATSSPRRIMLDELRAAREEGVPISHPEPKP
jgi:hypothetical protein